MHCRLRLPQPRPAGVHGFSPADPQCSRLQPGAAVDLVGGQGDERAGLRVHQRRRHPRLHHCLPRHGELVYHADVWNTVQAGSQRSAPSSLSARSLLEGCPPSSTRPSGPTRLTPLVDLFGDCLRLGGLGFLRQSFSFLEERERHLGLSLALGLRGFGRRRQLHDVRRRPLERVDDGDTYRRENELQSDPVLWTRP